MSSLGFVSQKHVFPSLFSSSKWSASWLSAQTASILHLHVITRSVTQKHGFSHHSYTDIQPDRHSWMQDHHPKLNLAKTELLVTSAKPNTTQ